jgi:hypothetical protein
MFEFVLFPFRSVPNLILSFETGEQKEKKHVRYGKRKISFLSVLPVRIPRIFGALNPTKTFVSS